MRVLCLIVILAALGTTSRAHPLHLSVTNITLENGKLKVQLKTFRDDWETAYFHYQSQVIDFTDSEERKNPWFGQYLQDCFKMNASETGNQIILEVDTLFLEQDLMTIEMSGSLKSDTNSLYIYNTLLTDIFPDQTNLVIFGFKNRETGIKFDVRKKRDEIRLSDWMK